MDQREPNFFVYKLFLKHVHFKKRKIKFFEIQRQNGYFLVPRQEF